MRTTLTAVSAIALLASIAPAAAADVYSSAKDPVGASYNAPANWTGFYVGVNGGYGQNFDSLDTDLVLTSPSAPGHEIRLPVKGPDVSGFLFGGQAGYLWQMAGSGLVFGAKLEFDGTNMTGDAVANPLNIYVDGTPYSIAGSGVTTTMHQQVDWIIAPTATLGLAIGSVMPFVEGGPAFGHVQESVAVGAPGIGNLLTASREGTDSGYVVGGGVAYKSGSWIFDIKYDYYDFGDHNIGKSINLGGGAIINATAKNHETYETIKASMNYQLGSVYQPLK